MRQLPRKYATEQKNHCSKLLDRLSVKNGYLAIAKAV